MKKAFIIFASLVLVTNIAIAATTYECTIAQYNALRYVTDINDGTNQIHLDVSQIAYVWEDRLGYEDRARNTSGSFGIIGLKNGHKIYTSADTADPSGPNGYYTKFVDFLKQCPQFSDK